MKQRLFIIVTTLLLIPMGLFAQTYASLWKQVEEAQQKDLPQTAMSQVEKIVQKAQCEQAYGQLLRGVLLRAQLQAEVAPDSLKPAVERLEQQEQRAESTALQSVYAAVLYRLYQSNHQLADDWQGRSQYYFDRATAHPEALAQVNTDDYVPFIVKAKDSEVFRHDLLSVVGMELQAWQWLNRYYVQTGNRPAACLTALSAVTAERQSNKDLLRRLDSLLAVYGDLPEAVEIAISRYDAMDNENSNPAVLADWLQQSLKRWGTQKRADLLRNHWRALVNPTFHMEAPCRVAEAGKAQTVRFSRLRNLQSLTMRVYRTSLQGDTQLNPGSTGDYKKIQAGLKELKDMERTLTFTGHAEYELFEDSTELAALPAGVYLLEFQTQPDTQVTRMLYFVSGVRLMMQAMPAGRMRYVVVDATTGQPIAGANVRLGFSSRNSAKDVKTLTCDAKGEAVYHIDDNKRPVQAYAFTGADTFCPVSDSYGRYTYYERQYNSQHTSVFTDRSIYRPGQTVHATAILWKETSPVDNEALGNRTISFDLRDANYKSVATQQVTTDRFGKCSVQFTLPEGLLNGLFTIRANGASTTIRVEEYKRPTFQVEFPEYKESYEAGDTVHAQAKALTFAGVPVQGAQVKYTVRRRVAYWWMSYSWYWQSGYMGRGMDEEIVGEGEAVTADDGTFFVDMPLVLPPDIGRSSMFYNFTVEADVTDVAGETHSGSLTLPLGSKPTALTCDVPQKVRNDQLPKVTFSRRNAAGREITGTVKYRIDNGKWQQAVANSQLSILSSQLRSGEHRLHAICEKDSVDVKFVIFSLDDKRPATKTDDWFYVSDSQFPRDGRPVTLQVGSSNADLHIVYGIYAGDREIESGTVKKSGELVNRKFTYQEDYGNGLLVTYAWVKNGQCHLHQQTISRPMPDKKLRLSWETFRDRLTPGQQEEWRLKVSNPDGTPADASLLSVLYDKSLDQIYPHQWFFAPSNQLSVPATTWQWTAWGMLSAGASQNYRGLSVPSLNYSRFDDSVFPRYSYRIMVRGATRMNKAALAGVVPEMAYESAMATSAFDVKGNDMATGEVLKAKETVVAADDVAGHDDKNSQKGEEVQLRENLQETAFFYPTIEADQNGQLVLKFTLPESLTTWRFMGVANTPQMLYGNIDGEAVAQKDVMVQPNVPRFLRIGDDARISARLFNTSERAASGQARLTLVAPETGRTVYEQTASFAVEAGKTGSVTFAVNASDAAFAAHSLLICRVVAQGDGFSDGEQHYLPILPDREYVTKTVPYTQHEPGMKTIDLSKLFPTGTTQQKLTVEYTNNPAWLMVQSLPVVGQPWEHSAIEQAASYYSNSLAQMLLKQSPQVKTTFEQWKRENREEPTLLSQLQKDQELKDLVLTETPWVWAADREAEQKQRLADFFDENGIDNRLNTAVDKLKKLQNSDGSFSWYPGMEGSTMVTVTVEEMLARLAVMAGSQSAVQQMQDKAFRFIGNEMVDLVKQMKKAEKKGQKPTFPSFTALRWLYICAIDGRTLSADVKAANDYLVRLLKKDIKQQTIYEKGLTAVILSKRGEAKLAKQYVQSLKEYTVFTEEMGRYYDTQRASYSWYDYKIPTEVAAIEAIQSVSPDDRQTVDEMRRWLLQEKRTQAWDTPISSVNAIYAFLNGATASLDSQGAPSILAIDSQPVELPKATAGLGYVKTAISEPKGQSFTATKTSEGTSWGAVYAQFFQKTTEVEAASSGISVRRELLPLTSLSPLTSLNVGDRIRVRITIETQRDLDFVQVVDRRAACMEPVQQLSGFRRGAYVSPKDNATHYFYYGLAKGKHVIETEYYIDRAGQYETGTCTVGCAYAPEFRATAPSVTLKVQE